MKHISHRKLFAVTVLLVLGVGLLYATGLDVRATLHNRLTQIAELGAVGAVFFVVLYIGATVAFLPGSILTLGAGAVYGLFQGFILVSFASTVGAALAFLVGRYAARSLVERLLTRYQSLGALDAAVAQNGFLLVLLTRLSPVFPFNVLNYFYGLTNVGFWTYVSASWIGMVPGTLLYVYLGSIAGTLARTDAPRERTTIEWVFYLLGLAATAVVTIYSANLARRAIRTQLPEQ
ncbi:MAG: TVP38/TMEM64 family protein [Bdellovibrionales bacterium]|nr:TVP38/TMEM64 family protein [Bdellovibrionales bacterium]